MEIMATVGLIGIALVPLLRLLLIGKSGSIQSGKFLIVSNLAREKIQESLVIPFGQLKEDYLNFRLIYKDCMIPEFSDAEKNREIFYSVFNDVWLDEDRRKYPQVFEKFKETYLNVYGQEYLIYPDYLKEYKRFTIVEEEYTKKKKLIKKVNVHIFLEGTKNEAAFTLTQHLAE